MPEPQPEGARAPAVFCRGVVKRFYRYEHRTTSLREVFIRTVRGRPLHVRHAQFALGPLDLRVEPGEAVALIGRNGSGKSTVLRLMAGIYQPSEGLIETRGRVSAVIELGAGFSPELTGAENLALYGAIMGLTPHQVADRYDDIVAFADIGAFINEPVKYYSSGMQARLAFSIAVNARPDILLLDEVLAVGDQSFQTRCLERLQTFRADGVTMIVVSHSLAVVQWLCGRTVWLDEGKVRVDGPTDAVLAAYQEAVS